MSSFYILGKYYNTFPFRSKVEIPQTLHLEPRFIPSNFHIRS